jgi:hypothetical protein
MTSQSVHSLWYFYSQEPMSIKLITIAKTALESSFPLLSIKGQPTSKFQHFFLISSLYPTLQTSSKYPSLNIRTKIESTSSQKPYSYHVHSWNANLRMRLQTGVAHPKMRKIHEAQSMYRERNHSRFEEPSQVPETSRPSFYGRISSEKKEEVGSSSTIHEVVINHAARKWQHVVGDLICAWFVPDLSSQ